MGVITALRHCRGNKPRLNKILKFRLSFGASNPMQSPEKRGGKSRGIITITPIQVQQQSRNFIISEGEFTKTRPRMTCGRQFNSHAVEQQLNKSVTTSFHCHWTKFFVYHDSWAKIRFKFLWFDKIKKYLDSTISCNRSLNFVISFIAIFSHGISFE